MYITNNPDVAIIAQNAGIDRIWVDLETKGKEERQKNLDTLKSHHTIDDIKRIKAVMFKSELLVRINPFDSETEEEIEKVISNGADIIMLPMWKTVEEVKSFLKIVNKRCKVILLLETKEAAECIDDVLMIDGIDEIHIGINDLSLSYKKKFMFEVVSNGLVERLIKKIKMAGIPCGFGGITKLHSGLVPAEIVIAEHYRLGSTMAILARSFCDLQSFDNDLVSLEDYFIKNVNEIRNFEKGLNCMPESYFLENNKKLCSIVCEVVKQL